MKKYLLPLIFFAFFFLAPVVAKAAPIPIPNLSLGVGQAQSPEEISTAIQVLLLLTVLSLAPSLIILMTSFTRIVIVLSFVRNAIGTQQAPPTQLIVGLSLFLTFMVMSPTFKDINENAVQPFTAGEITQEVAFEKAVTPLRNFMFKQTRKKDMALFVKLAQLPRPKNREDVPTHVLIPSFIVSEIKTAFQMGFAIFIPFLVLDVVIASLLMSMGMMMLPPIMISLPFKILLFVLVDGWSLISRSLVLSFN